MKKIYIAGSDAVMFDPETDNVAKAPYTRTSIRDVMLIKEPAQVIYECGDQKHILTVDTDDIVVIFYNGTFEKNVVVVKGNTDWIDNLKKYEAEEQKRKEEWAAKQAAGECEPCENKCC